MVTKPNPALMTVNEFNRLYGETSLLFAEEVDQLLNLERDELLALARSRREEAPRPGPLSLGVAGSPTEDAETLEACRVFLRHWYADKIAKRIETLVPILDEIDDRRLRLRALKNINLLAEDIQGEARNCLELFLEEERAKIRTRAKAVLAKVQTAPGRVAKTRQREKRLKRFRPIVEELENSYPSDSNTQIAKLLLKWPGLQSKYKVPIGTLRKDVVYLRKREKLSAVLR